MYKIQKKIDKCLDLVARDEKVVAPCQHLSYYPFAAPPNCGGKVVAPATKGGKHRNST